MVDLMDMALKSVPLEAGYFMGKNKKSKVKYLDDSSYI